MKESFKLAGVALLVFGLTGLAIGLFISVVSLPFAGIGWVVMTIIGVFMTVSVSYIEYVAVGLGTAIGLGYIKFR